VPASKETRKAGRACRVGPGEWALRPEETVPAETASAAARGTSAGAPLQPLPRATSSMLETRSRN
jgi:hypothetical protein